MEACRLIMAFHPCPSSFQRRISHPRTSPPPSRPMLFRVASLRQEDDLRWQPLFRFETDDLMADAPYLRQNCDDLDWKRRAGDLRALAKLDPDPRHPLLATEAEAKGSKQIGTQQNDDPLHKDYGEQGAPSSISSFAVVSPAVYAFLAACQAHENLYVKGIGWIIVLSSTVTIINLLLHGVRII